jgi:integrase
VYKSGGVRHRHTLATTDPVRAQQLAPAIYGKLIGPHDKKVVTLWTAYCEEHEGRAVLATMKYTWRAIESRFGGRDGDAISVRDCMEHITARRDAGIKDWTIYTELGHLRTVLNWARKRGFLERPSYIKRPPEPKVERQRLTREQVQDLVDASVHPHARLYVVLLYSTAARTGALLGLTWDRVDFKRRVIDLRDPNILQPHKGRAVVPMTSSAYELLVEAQQVALCEHVIEWAGRPVKKVRRALERTAERAGLDFVTPHILRHSAATHMAEDGVSMEEIRQFLGHDNIETTRQIYAIYSPDHLRKAAASLELRPREGNDVIK